MRFFTGLHQPSDARHFDAAFVSARQSRDRRPIVDDDPRLTRGEFVALVVCVLGALFLIGLLFLENYKGGPLP